MSLVLEKNDTKHIENIAILYTETFNTKYTSNDIKKLLKQKENTFYFTVDNDTITSIMRLKKLHRRELNRVDKELLDFSHNETVYYISDLISTVRGNGTKLIEEAITLAKNDNADLFTSVWKESLIGYYEQFDFYLTYKDQRHGRILFKYNDSTTDNEIEYVYHYSNDFYNDIRPIGLQETSDAILKERVKTYGEAYGMEVNAFPSVIKIEWIEKLIKNGFKNWDSKPLYEYKISLNRNIENITKIDFTSTEKGNKIVKPLYDEYTKKIIKAAGVDNWDEIRRMSDEEFKPYEDMWIEYKQKSEELLTEVGEVNFSIKDYYNKKEVKGEFRDLQKFVYFNIRKGNKDQYATWIPHLQLMVTKPIVYERIKKIR